MQKIISLLLLILVSTSLSFAGGNKSTQSNSWSNRAEKIQDIKDRAASYWTKKGEQTADTNRALSTQGLLKSNSAAEITNISLTFSETKIEFSEDNTSIITVDKWGGEQYPGHVYCFTLEDDTYLRINYNQDFAGFLTKSTTLSEENIISEFYLDDMPFMSEKLEAGTYYLVILYFEYDIYYSLDISEIFSTVEAYNVIELPYFGMNLPFTEGNISLVTLNPDDGFQLPGQVFQFTIDTHKNVSINFDESFVGLLSSSASLSEQSLIHTFTGSESFVPLDFEPGTYYMFVIHAAYDKTYSISITVNHSPSIVDISLPFDETKIEFSESTTDIITVDMWGGDPYASHVYRFTLEDDTYLRIDFDQDFAGFITKSTTLSEENIISEFYLSDIPFKSGKLEAGTYYLVILYYDNNISYSLSVYEYLEPTVYTELDYTTMLAKGESKSGKVNTILEPHILTPNWLAAGSAFSIEVEEGQGYLFTYDVYLPEASHIGSEISLLCGGEFQGDGDDFNGDLIRSGWHYTDNKQLSLSSVVSFKADFTGTLRILLQTDTPVLEFTYSIRVDETEFPFSFEPISLPYLNEELVFLPSSVYYMDHGERALGFTFTLDEETTLIFQGYNDYYDWGPSLSIYDNEDLQNPIKELEWLLDYKITLNAGSYYILVSDAGFYDAPYYSCYLAISNLFSVADLLDAATDISYDDLPFFNEAYFDLGTSSIVEGDGSFRTNGYLYFAEAYKLSLNVDEKLKIYHSSLDFDAYLFVYGKDSEGNYIRLYYNDDGASAYKESTGNIAFSSIDSFIEFEATKNGDYYIIATSFSSKKTGEYSLNIWLNEEEPVPSYITVAELLDAAADISYDDLPFFNEAFFDFGTSSLVRGDDNFRSGNGIYFAEAYKLSLNVDDKLKIYHSSLDFDAYLYVYGKDSEGNYIRLYFNDDGGSDYKESTGNIAFSSGDSFLEFEATETGDYYIVATTLFSLKTGEYSLNIWSSEEGPATPYITVAELLDAATDIPYDDLPVIKETYFDAVTTSLVAGDGTFRHEDNLYFAEAYKLSLNVGDNLKIHHSHENDAYLYVYGKDTEGDYISLESNDDGYGYGYDAYIEFEAAEAGDYYIIATSYYSNAVGTSLLRIWKTGDEPIYQITSLSSSSDKIKVSTEATEMELLLVLTQLTIEGKTNEGKTFALSNSPYLWTISEDAKSATFVPLSMDNYEIATSLSLVVLLDDETSIESIKDQEQKGLNVYTFNRSITIENAALGANLAVYDIAGHLLVYKQVNAVPETVSVPNAGVYIVRVGTEVVKVICR